MEPLNFPPIEAKLKRKEGRTLIFDPVRRLYVTLTPEEWVRQHVIYYLSQYLHYPLALMEVEKGHKNHLGNRRCDIIARNRKLEIIMLVECKASSVKLSETALNQLVQYNIEYKSPLLLLTNGLKHYCVRIDFQNQTTTLLEQIPAYSE